MDGTLTRRSCHEPCHAPLTMLVDVGHSGHIPRSKACPRWGSNPHCADFKSAASAGWATGACAARVRSGGAHTPPGAWATCCATASRLSKAHRLHAHAGILTTPRMTCHADDTQSRPDVDRLIEDAVHRERRPTKQVINDALRRALAPPTGARSEAYRLIPHDSGLRPIHSDSQNGASTSSGGVG
jgi:hypothetical protein